METIYVLCVLAYCLWDFQGEFILEMSLSAYQKSYVFFSKNKNDIVSFMFVLTYAISCFIQIYVCIQLQTILCEEPKPNQERPQMVEPPAEKFPDEPR